MATARIYLWVCSFLLSFLLLVPSITQAERLKVGVSLPLSGAVSAYGVAFNSGLQLFLEEHPDVSKTLEIIVDDTQYDGKKVVSSLRKMVSIDEVDLSFVWGVVPVEVAAPIAQQMKAPLIAMTTEAAAKDRPYVAALQIPLEGLNKVLLSFIDKKKIKKIGIISANFGSAERFLDILRPALPEVVFDELISDSGTDLNSVVSRVKSKSAEAVLLFAGPDQILAISRAAAAQQFRTLAIGGDNFGDDELRAKVAQAFGKAVYIYGAVNQDFKERYMLRFKNTSNIFEAASGYSLGKIFAALAQDQRRGVDIISGLVGRKFQTPIGDLEFTATEEGIKLQLIPMVYE